MVLPENRASMRGSSFLPDKNVGTNADVAGQKARSPSKPDRRPGPIFTNEANLRPHGPAGEPRIHARFELPLNKKTSARMPT
jgi:hypothetical protein